MKTILCYGDSNTWGYDPNAADEKLQRLPAGQRWPRVMGRALGDGYDILEEGLSGRTTVFEDAATPGRNGLALLAPILHTHQPMDLLVFMLGTNDTKPKFAASAEEIANGMQALLKVALDGFQYDSRKPPKVLVISPIHVTRDITPGIFDAASVETSQQLAGAYALLAARYGCGFLDAAQVTAPSPADGIHLDAGGHQALGGAVAVKVKEMLG